MSAVPRRANAIGSPETRTLLVIDADPDVARTLRSSGDGTEFTVDLAPTPRDALDRAARGDLDAIVLSLALPDQDAIVLIAQIRAIPALRGVPLAVIVSEASELTKLEHALAAGADDFVRRPVDALELRTRMRTLVRLRTQVVEARRESAQLARVNAELEVHASTDALTETHNRRTFERRLREEVERVRRHGQALTLVVMDIDHFKRVNDSHGHAVGDEVLKAVSSLVQRAIRTCDIFARIGGEEFALLAPATREDGARILCERLRAAIAGLPIFARTGSGYHTTLHISASFGIAVLEGRDRPGADAGAWLFESADAALFRAKRGGRNRVECAEA